MKIEAPLFDEVTSRRLEEAYRTRDASRRRSAVQDSLAPTAGERIIDIGTGPGFVPFEIAGLVLPGGEVLGVDISEPMLELARARCAGQPNVRFENADAVNLPVPDASCDAAVSIQVYEYIEDVDQAIRELNRILRPGGRAAIISTDWPSIAWNSSSDDLMRRVLASFAQHCPHQQLPRTLAPRLRSAGFDITEQRVLPIFNPSYDPDSFSFSFIDVVASFVARKGIAKEESAAWAADLRRLGEMGDYFFCVNQFLFLVSKEEAVKS